jgi:predicted kinase
LVIVITGPVGVGKSTTAGALADVLEAADIRNAMIDMDYLRWVSHRPEDDPHHSRLAWRNLAAVSAIDREVGVDVFIIANVVEDPRDRDRYEIAIPGARVSIVRLRLPLDRIAARLHSRMRDQGEALAWHLSRAPELEGIMDAAGIGSEPRDLMVEMGNRPPEAVAKEIAIRTGLIYEENA